MSFTSGELLQFLTISVIVTVVPGADMALIRRQVLTGDVRTADLTVAGNLTGLAVHGVAALRDVSLRVPVAPRHDRDPRSLHTSGRVAAGGPVRS